MKEIYLLKSCNEWKEHSSAKIITATDDRHTLLAMISGEILLGNMNYGGLEKGEAYIKLLEDIAKGIEVEKNIEYGYVETVEVISENDREALKERYKNFVDILPNPNMDEEDEEFEM